MFLERLDLLYFEDIGMISAEDFAAIDLILQHLKNIESPFGGVLVLGSGDPNQMPPPTGSQIWISPIILTSVSMFKLNRAVKMTDSIGQNFLALISKPELTEDEIMRILTTISQRCNFESVTQTNVSESTPIYGTRAVEKKQ